MPRRERLRGRMTARKCGRHWVHHARPLKNRSPPVVQKHISQEALGQAVSQVMHTPAFNVQWMPDMVEYYVHKQAVETMLETIAAIPPVTLYGHRIRVVVEPMAGDERRQ